MTTHHGFEYRITDPKGKVHITDNLALWAEQRGYRVPIFRVAMRREDHTTWNGYKVEKLSGSLHRKYIVTEPNGREVEITNLAEYARKHGLGPQGLRLTAQSRAKDYFGYKLRYVDEEATKRQEWFTVAKPDGTKVRIKNLLSYCKEHHLSSEHMRRVAAGKQKSHKKYKIWRIF